MADNHELTVGPVQPVGSAVPVQPVRGQDGQPPQAEPPALPPHVRHPHTVAAATTGKLFNAYAQFVINPDTHDVVIRVKDATTDRVLSEYPSREVETMHAYMKKYAETAARLRAAQSNGSSH